MDPHTAGAEEDRGSAQRTVQRSPRTPTPAADVLSASQPSTTKAGLPRQRMAWTKEMNTTVMRCFFIATRLETISSGYRYEFRQLFLKEYPELTNVTEQRLSDQKRVIINNHKLSAEEIQLIKEKVASEMRSNENLPDNVMTSNNRVMDEPVPETASLQPPPSTSNEAGATQAADDRLLQQVKEEIIANVEKWRGSHPNSRSRLPKLRMSHTSDRMIELINTEIIKDLITAQSNLEEIHLVVYSCASAVTTLIGQKPIIEENKKPKQKRKPLGKADLKGKLKN